ncbi:hypothetical protein AD45P2_00385 [Alteromonas phage vB_AmaP_AD45-P2]|uniref:Uncharacterized protein n=1 Tax=Pseudorhizobium pelagicum TaxID=1509405 RepID=A0A922NZ98_9HYPH|nr:hypothetical protein [Pseudorhizobium pelagicum]YP_008126047.1 hypothetical protein M610_gp105 [Alteromonas phage vB_AmaP_AD45-P1]AGM46894.1 hypothetical protein AD45P1_00380 [Alteromonas phage vB_AmaP_AD45-P1]AGM47248.1 hypothetical protein AD45P2_00385 [Alteromonas phage vB_AmaP_AD45-P2]KEQ05632.1 hypothetical protein GV68_08875 [Pseudorhizobium pelagicum]
MSRFYKVTKRIYSNDLKVTEHPDGNWVKREEYEQLKQRCAELDEIADTAFKYNHSSAQCLRAWRKLQQLRKEQE